MIRIFTSFLLLVCITSANAQSAALAKAEAANEKNDMREAVKWYMIAAEQKDPKAAYYVGLFYEDGVQLPKDFSKAFEWYKKAGDLGNYNGYFAIALHYLDSWVAETVFEKMAGEAKMVKEYFAKAAALGDPDATAKLNDFTKDENDFLVARAKGIIYDRRQPEPFTVAYPYQQSELQPPGNGKYRTCLKCNGSGQIYVPNRFPVKDKFGNQVFGEYIKCFTCGGTGRDY